MLGHGYKYDYSDGMLPDRGWSSSGLSKNSSTELGSEIRTLVDYRAGLEGM